MASKLVFSSEKEEFPSKRQHWFIELLRLLSVPKTVCAVHPDHLKQLGSTTPMSLTKMVRFRSDTLRLLDWSKMNITFEYGFVCPIVTQR